MENRKRVKYFERKIAIFSLEKCDKILRWKWDYSAQAVLQLGGDRVTYSFSEIGLRYRLLDGIKSAFTVFFLYIYSCWIFNGQ